MITIQTLEVGGIVPALMSVKLPFSKQTSIDDVLMDYGKKTNEEIEYDTNLTPEMKAKYYSMSISPKSLKLLSNLQLSGDDHGKANRGIIAYALIKAPIYWWIEMETYRIGHERLSSQSTMHVDAKGLEGDELVKFKADMPMGKELIKIDSFSYQTLRHIYFSRRDHRLPHWHVFCDWIKTLPLSKELITREKEQANADK